MARSTPEDCRLPGFSFHSTGDDLTELLTGSRFEFLRNVPEDDVTVETRLSNCFLMYKHGVLFYLVHILKLR